MPQRQSETRHGRLAKPVMGLAHYLLVVRHGQTQWNVEDRMATHTDVPPAELGIAHADVLGESLAGARFDRAYSSPLRRTLVTTEAGLRQAGVGHAIKAVARLVEPSAGPFEGRVWRARARGGLGPHDAYASHTDELEPVYPFAAESLEQSVARPAASSPRSGRRRAVTSRSRMARSSASCCACSSAAIPAATGD